MNNYKLGSLFDGSGGFPLAGALCGVTPTWAAEVEPYPIAVTRSRFPNMKHLGDISKVNGAEIEPVDIITFGSPCQDLSVAGKRAGLKHEANGDEETTRSGLFMEAVRIIKEMRRATNGKYPRFAIWENVPGAFSGNNGQDFRVVLEELIKIVEPYAVMPDVPPKGWAYADSYVGDGWSLAYRVFDAQYWGVPQRRRRIYLVADFGGLCAREILFEREGLRGYFEAGRTPWQAAPADAQGSPGADDREGEGNGGDRGRQLDAIALASVASTLRAGAGAPKHEQDFVGRLVLACAPRVYEWHNQDTRIQGPINTGCTLNTNAGGREGHLVLEPFCKSARARSADDATTWKHGDVANTLNTFDQGEARANELVVVEVPPRYVVRRLTPTECARLQGFADQWGWVEEKKTLTEEEYRFWLEVRNTHARINGKPEKDYTEKQMLTWYNRLWTDGAEYKMWGNGIALPTALYCLQGVADALEAAEMITDELNGATEAIDDWRL